MVIHEPPGLNRVARLQGRTTPRAVKTVDRPREEWTEIAVPAIVYRGHLRPCAPAAGRQQAVRLPQQQGPVAAAGPGRLLGLRLRLLPRPHDHHGGQQALLLPVPGQRRLPLPGRQSVRQQAGPRRLPRHRRLGPYHRPARRPGPDPHRDRPPARAQARASDPVTRQRKQLELALAKASHLGHRDDRGLLRAADHHRRTARQDAAPARTRGQVCAASSPPSTPRPPTGTPTSNSPTTSTASSPSCAAAQPPPASDERQRVLRLLVKDILIGPDKITIRHRIPVRADGTGAAAARPRHHRHGG